MRLDKLGIPVYSSDDVIDLIYQGKSDILKDILVEPDTEINQFNNNADEPLKVYQELSILESEFDSLLQNDWLMPEHYKKLDIEAWLYEQTPPWDPEHTRVQEELEAFKQRNMLDLLRWMKYFVDTCRTNNVVWGVGRGSSVASYVLYLIGVHKINSLKYNLDWREFLR
jgi:DNA polymerase III alpha subunit